MVDKHLIISCSCDHDYLLTLHLLTSILLNRLNCAYFIVHSIYSGKTDFSSYKANFHILYIC